jgi:hypothetical protein
MRKHFSGFSLFVVVSALLVMVGCQGQEPSSIRTVVNPALLGAQGIDEELSAPLSLAGLGDRVCVLKYSFVKKKGADFDLIANDQLSDNSKRAGFGRGCMNFCIAAFDQLREKNEEEKKGISVLIRSCKFTGNDARIASATSPLIPVAGAASAAVASEDVATSKRGFCKIVGGAHKLLLGEIALEDECKTQCDLRSESNPNRRCAWKDNVFRKHPKNFCTIQGSGGKIHYNKKVRKFICRSECKAREVSNPQRSCEWGDELLRDHPKP